MKSIMSIGDGKGEAMGLQPHLLLSMLHKILLFTIKILFLSVNLPHLVWIPSSITAHEMKFLSSPALLGEHMANSYYTLLFIISYQTDQLLLVVTKCYLTAMYYLYGTYARCGEILANLKLHSQNLSCQSELIQEFRHLFLCVTYGPIGRQRKHDCALTRMSA